MEIRKINNRLWKFVDTEIGEFSPSKFTINRLNNEITVVYFNNLKSKDYNVSDVNIFDIPPAVAFNTSNGDDFMAKLEELNCPCFQKDETIIIGGGSDPLKLDKVTTAGVERTYIINPDGSQDVKPTSDFKDVIEGYFNGTNFYTDAGFTILITPESGKIYVALDTNSTYRWSGSAYVQIGGGSQTYIFEYAQPALPTTTNWQVSNYNSSKRDEIFRNNTATTYPTLNRDVGSHYIRKTGNIKKIIFKMLRINPGIAIDFDIYVAKFVKENGDINFGTETIIANKNISSNVLSIDEAFIVEFTLLNTSVTEGEHLYIAFRNNTGVAVTLLNPQIIIITE